MMEREEKVYLGLKEVEETLSQERALHHKCRTERNELSLRFKREKQRVLELERANAELKSRCAALEVSGFEERTKWAEKLRNVREQCLEDAVETFMEFLGDNIEDDTSQSVKPPQLSEIIHSAQKLIEKLDDDIILNDAGAALRETLFAIAHPYGTPPPLDPTVALPAAVSCVEFAVSVSLALLALDDDSFSGNKQQSVSTMSRPLLNVSAWMIRKLAKEDTIFSSTDVSHLSAADHSSRIQRKTPLLDVHVPKNYDKTFVHSLSTTLPLPNTQQQEATCNNSQSRSKSPPRSPYNPFLEDYDDNDHHQHVCKSDDREYMQQHLSLLPSSHLTTTPIEEETQTQKRRSSYSLYYENHDNE
uniref:Uncharacterized protein n=1 Tax=Aureoumbra lagunensis TaxID=44058 RepID=A0A6S8ATQ9_9STRA|mmetsp:Transcript_11021/g.13764  ORF Transcript_11021/g.13764 Transcript_11021/m.13764 type:complete len:360 (+) Transcript_11021:35-1114(+)